ncbi:unnamed protein product, partial [Nesidiocoris tenuis]
MGRASRPTRPVLDVSKNSKSVQRPANRDDGRRRACTVRGANVRPFFCSSGLFDDISPPRESVLHLRADRIG